MLTIALASQSPRRQELLQRAGYDFHVFPVKVSEIFDENLNATDVVSQLATRKAGAAVEQFKELKSQGYLILAADTLVVHQGRVLGKPHDVAEAQTFLRILSGNMHSVMTGLCLLESGSTKMWSGYAETKVEFRTLQNHEIAEYVATGEPMDKAGAYAIQGLGRKFVSCYTGSWSNVVGLPLELLQSSLIQNGWNVSQRSPQTNS